MKQTKIVASISDRRCDTEFIKKLYKAGVNVIRMNTAHATPEGIKTIISNARQVSKRLGILIDTKGPEVRSTTTSTDEPIIYNTGEKVRIHSKPNTVTTHDDICVSYERFHEDVNIGNHVLFDDGELDMLIVEKEGEALVAEVQNDGKLGSRKSVNVPGVHIDLPSLTEKDKRNILLAIEENIDFIAHSFVRNKQDVLAVQEILDEHNSEIKIISKIENQEGVDNIDEIIDASYGIMIARGDLGIEVPIEEIPGLQRRMINKCIKAKKPVIVATQMLHTMINNPRPTRAEVTDIANAIYSHTDALMLSGETASGKYPVEAVKTMAAIAEQAEKDQRLEHKSTVPLPDNCTLRDLLSHNAIESTERLGVTGIITDCGTGQIARNLSAFRGPTPILALCYGEQMQRWLALSYGITAVYVGEQHDKKAMFSEAVRRLRKNGAVHNDDFVAYISGNMGEAAGSSFLEITRVSDTLGIE